MGFSDEFLNSMEELMQPDSSALLVLVDHKGADELFESLVDQQSVILRHTLTDQIVEQLMQEESTDSVDRSPENEAGS
jgi:uncharacterized membrane protein